MGERRRTRGDCGNHRGRRAGPGAGPWLLALGLARSLGACKKSETQAPEPTGDEAGEQEGEGELEELEEDPYLNPSNFITVVEGHMDEIDACYGETAGKEADAPTGRVRATIVIDRDGVVKDVTYDDQRSDLKHDGLYACIKDAAMKWSFPTSIGELDQPMPYTFKF